MGPFRSLMGRLLVAFLVLCALPLGAVGFYVSHRLSDVRRAAHRSATTYERRAQSIARRVAEFLGECEKDLVELAALPRSAEAYLTFADQHRREIWIRGGTNDQMVEIRRSIPLYKEISFINPSGSEQILVRGENLVPRSELRDVSDPARTTYRRERYFERAMANKPQQIYVSHLHGFHLTKFEQLGVDRLIERLVDTDERAKKIYRFMLYSWLQQVNAVEIVNRYREADNGYIVYRVPGKDRTVTIEDPGPLGEAERRAREMELRHLVDELAPEDVVEGERFDGVIRFAMPVVDDQGNKLGVVSLALDHTHLQQFTQHVRSMEENAVVFAGYRGANYTYLFDDEGWIITHPKMWNIRGVDRRGKPVAPYTAKSDSIERLTGRIPVNLMKLDWKLGRGYHRLVYKLQQGRTDIASAFNLGGVPRTRVYSPIFYSTGEYAKHGIFGGVMLGTDSQSFIQLMRQMNVDISNQISALRRSIFWPLLVVFLCVAVLSIVVARNLVRPVRLLSQAARRIGEGDLDSPVPPHRGDEIGVLADAFGEMVRSLKQSFAKLNRRNQELKETQQKLLRAEKEKQRKLEQEVAQLQQEIARSSFASMIARSPQMKRIQEEIVRVASSSATVLIRGDNGTGKELIAESIHLNSGRREQKFVRVNCASFNENLLESELFGHVKGAYTGAAADRKGLFVLADGGTLLLDEIGDMSLNMQKKLLRTLEQGEITPLGSHRVIRVDVRILAATNRDFEQLMGAGQFREDLYHRLNVINIYVPPLRERKADILPLAKRFVRQFAEAEDRPVIGLSAEAEQFLQNYPWPGNVRELKNATERAVVRTRNNILEVDDFQLAIEQRNASTPAPVGDPSSEITLAEAEKEHILRVLARCDGNKKSAARILDIGYNTLWRKLKKYEESN